MGGLGAEYNAQLIKGVKMLKLHIDLGMALVIVKKVEQRIAFAADADVIFVFVEGQVVDQHGSFLPFMVSSGQSSRMHSWAGIASSAVKSQSRKQIRLALWAWMWARPASVADGP